MALYVPTRGLLAGTSKLKFAQPSPQLSAAVSTVAEEDVLLKRGTVTSNVPPETGWSAVRTTSDEVGVVELEVVETQPLIVAGKLEPGSGARGISPMLVVAVPRGTSKVTVAL